MICNESGFCHAGNLLFEFRIQFFGYYSEFNFLDIRKVIGQHNCTLASSFLRTPLRSGVRGVLGAEDERGGGSPGLKRERKLADQPQVANQFQVDIIDPNSYI